MWWCCGSYMCSCMCKHGWCVGLILCCGNKFLVAKINNICGTQWSDHQGARIWNIVTYTSQFFIEKAERLSNARHVHSCCCPCPHMHVLFCCSAQLHCTFFHWREPVHSGSSCMSHLKHCTQAHIFAYFHSFTQLRICASFCCQSVVCICEELHSEHFLG